MSDPPSTSSTVSHHQPLILSPPPAAASVPREYRKGNWTLQETLVLITAKKMDDERRASAQSSKPSSSSASSPSTSSSCKMAELRWKWVENYCWSHGCHRSQNQCNDKWDNLLRDYKKVRDYESRPVHPKDRPSYWQMEKNERKERNLPSNLLLEVFQALHEVVTRRYSQKSSAPAGGGAPTVGITGPVAPPSLPPPPPLLPPPHLQALPPPPPPPQPPASGTWCETAHAIPPLSLSAELRSRAHKTWSMKSSPCTEWGPPNFPKFLKKANRRLRGDSNHGGPALGERAICLH